MNAIQKTTIAYALHLLADDIAEEGYPEAADVYTEFVNGKHGEGAPMTRDAIVALANDIANDTLPMTIVVEIKDGPRVFADCGRVIVIDMDNGPQDTPVPEANGRWASRNVYRAEREPIPDYARDWTELILKLMPEDTDD
jgi:hypothetical protein